MQAESSSISESTLPDATRIVAGSRSLIAYRVTDWPAMQLVTAPRTRRWMDNTRERFANRCLPLLMANQSGWWVLNSHPIRVVWTGGWDQSCIRIQSLDGSEHFPASGHFGEGVLTFNLPFLFRTPPGINLSVRGPANLPKDGIQALEGVVETDWSIATFTMNWKFTRTNWPVEFEKDEPICMVTPQQRSYLETFDPRIVDVREEPQTAQAYEQWSQSRRTFLKDQKVPDSQAVADKWQKHYFRGVAIDGTTAPDHQSKLELKEFEDQGPALYPPMPAVQPHPEALLALTRLGAGQSNAAEAFFEISRFARLYFHQYASDPHGSIVGALMCRALFPRLADGVSLDTIAKQWDELRHVPYDGIAAEAAVGMFSMGCAAASEDLNVRQGCERLWAEKLKAILPPPAGHRAANLNE